MVEGKAVEASRNGAQQHGRVEHLIVQAEIIARNQVDAGVGLKPPMAFAQGPGRGSHLIESQGALPIALDGPFELAVFTDSGKS